MIFTDRTIIVQKGASSINDTIILYRGDKEVEIRFTLNEGSPFKFGSGASPNIIEKTEAAYGQLIIKTPNDLPAIFSEIAPTNGGKIVFTITAEMIDEITEVGNYTFQIRLLDESRNSRATLPEVVDGIEIREPIALEDISTTNEVEVATVGYALTTAGTQEDAFNAEGNYNKTTWTTGDRITASKLNKIEAGIDGVNKKVASGGTSGGVADSVDWSNVQNKPTIPTNTSQLTNDSGFITNVPDEYITETELNARRYASEQYVDDAVNNASISGGYTHPATHPASMITGLSTVATSGSYNDLTNKPTIPTRTSELTNNSDFVDSAFVSQKIAEASLSGGEVDLSGYVTKGVGNASQIQFADGQTFQAKLDAGTLKGEKGDKGEQGPQGEKGDAGAQGPKGDKGDKGDQGEQGIQGLKGDKGDTGATGTDGATFTPSVDAEGNLSWTNDKGLANPPTVNIKGEKGDSGTGSSGANINDTTASTTTTYSSNKIETIKESLNSRINEIPKILIDKYNIDNTGKTDCTTNFKLMLENENYIYLKKGIYKISDLIIKDKTFIGEVGTKILVDTLNDYKEMAIRIEGKNYFENIIFEIKNTATRTYLTRLYNCNNIIFNNCEFNCFSENINSTKCPIDLYQNCQNIKFNNCTINACSDGDEGGVWIRNLDDTIENTTKNICFDNCTFNKKGGDEIIAIWGWKGYIENVAFNKCTMNGYNSSYKNPSHFITIGMTGTTNNVIVDGCQINIMYSSTTVGDSLFKSYKSITDIDNTDHGNIGDSCRIINTNININSTSDSKMTIFRCDASKWENYVIDKCHITSNVLLLRVGLHVHKFSNSFVDIPGVTDSMFEFISRVEGNNIKYKTGKLSNGSNFYKNSIEIENVGAVYLVQFSESGKAEFMNNNIKLSTSCNAMFGNDWQNLKIDLILKDNIFENVGMYLVSNSSSKYIVMNNIFKNISEKTLGNSDTRIASNNIVNGALIKDGWN